MSTAGSAMPARTGTPALRLVPTPRWEPPYDDELVRRRLGPSASGAAADGQAELALTYVLPSGVPAVPERPRLRLVPPEGLPGDELLFEPQPTSSVHLPDPRFWGGRLAQALVEVLHGVRPATQVRRWLSEEVYAQVRWQSQRRQAGHVQRIGPPGPARGRRQPPRVVVRSVRACQPADGVAEVSVVIHDGERARALALRLEGSDGRWRATVVQHV